MRSPDILIFMRTASDIDMCLYGTRLDRSTGQEVDEARQLRDRKLQRTLLPFFKPENDSGVRQALLAVGRGYLIGLGCDCLVPANPLKAVLQARMVRSRRELTEGHYVHAVDAGGEPTPAWAGAAPAAGYQPDRKSTRKNKHRPR